MCVVGGGGGGGRGGGRVVVVWRGVERGLYYLVFLPLVYRALVYSLVVDVGLWDGLLLHGPSQVQCRGVGVGWGGGVLRGGGGGGGGGVEGACILLLSFSLVYRALLSCCCLLGCGFSPSRLQGFILLLLLGWGTVCSFMDPGTGRGGGGGGRGGSFCILFYTHG